MSKLPSTVSCFTFCPLSFHLIPILVFWAPDLEHNDFLYPQEGVGVLEELLRQED